MRGKERRGRRMSVCGEVGGQGVLSERCVCLEKLQVASRDLIGQTLN